MPARTFRHVAPLLALAAALGLAGCESSDSLAPSDAVLQMLADPASLDVGEGLTGDSTISAIVLDDDGFPLSGVDIRFSTTQGTLSTTQSVETDQNGVATVVLTTDQTATVTARNGDLSNDITVTVNGVLGPLAAITFVPASGARVDEQLRFVASSSLEGDAPIVEYRWSLAADSGEFGVPDIENGESISRTYTMPTTVDVTLRVTDANGLSDTVFDFYDVLGDATMAP